MSSSSHSRSLRLHSLAKVTRMHNLNDNQLNDQHTFSDLSIEQVAALASQNALPVPTLDLDAIAPSTSTLTAPAYYRRDSTSMSASMPALSPSLPGSTPRRVPQHRYTSDDPWSFGGGGTSAGGGGVGALAGGMEGASLTNGAPSSVSGTGMPREWWKRQERVQVRLLGPQGFILNRYMAYEVASEVSKPPTLESQH